MILPVSLSRQDILTIAQSKQFGLGWREPQTLLTAKRFDITAKYLYALLRERDVCPDLRDAVYKNHLEIWNNFFEETPRKLTFEDFRTNFDAILESASASIGPGLHSIVPLASDGHPVNGAHRIAAALFLKKLVLSTTLDIDPSYANYNYRFFREQAKRFPHYSLEGDFDEMALIYARLVKRSRVITLFDPPADTEEIDRLINKHGDVVFDQYRFLNHRGRTNIIATMYESEHWIGAAESGFPGAQDKSDRCFPRSGNIRFVLFEPNTPTSCKELKQEIRALCGRENDSVHINDTHSETLRLSEIAFHEQTVDFLQAARLNVTVNLHTLIPSYLEATKDAPDAYCIDGGSTLAAYGLRDCEDIDYIHRCEPLPSDFDEKINSHNAYAKYYNVSSDRIIYGRANHFYYKGAKFASLASVKTWKARRREPKDLADLDLIEKFETA